MKKQFLISLIITLPFVAFADGFRENPTTNSKTISELEEGKNFYGTNSGGGGSTEESEFKEIVGEFRKWIVSDQFKGLDLKGRMGEDEYKKRMLWVTKKNVVQVEFAPPYEKIRVDGIEKDCKGEQIHTENIANSQYLVRCNIVRFNSKSQAGKYKLVHHELAILVGVETNIGAQSDYEISEQLQDFTQYQTVLKLGPKKQSFIPNRTLKLSWDDKESVMGHDGVKYHKLIKPIISLINNIEKTNYKISPQSNLNYICSMAGYAKAVNHEKQYFYSLDAYRIVIQNEQNYIFKYDQSPLKWILCK